ncbi:helix-turn-helix domain-containing protein [Cytophaga sp. FL35]|uniref:helix-turn-helix domain-containing protein n=1 Tax=Cytophaga sp. FL35 TaxID=1904456 RepID=UPI001653B50A|nr:helix-turn-helix domain-containing protein [Cytophaga sp. FL35]MBC6999821.1 AraC family transcriptional regulator [Cytophaga sp. FL35]
MKHFKKIEEYCKAINIEPPKHPHFDIRSFNNNMPTIVETMEAFRHEFYAIALKVEGGGRAITGHHIDFPDGSTIFFNSPFQLISWDIVPDWDGYYIMFSQDFVANSKYLQDIFKQFSFLKIEKTIPFEITLQEVSPIISIYDSIFEEYNGNNDDKFILIESYLLLLLNFVKRYFNKKVSLNEVAKEIRKTDVKILARFQTLIETRFYPNYSLTDSSNLHSTSYYANQLLIHPNHLNSIVKQITGHTAKQHIQNHVLNLAKSRLIHSSLSIKEIAYSLHFDSPNHFSVFFKKNTSKTPNSYRKEAIL